MTESRRNKISTSIDDLVKGLPKEFGKFMNYWRDLKFKEKPDYIQLRKYLQDIAERMNYEHDYYYDWIIKKNSKINVPIPPKIKAFDEEPKKPTQITDMKPPLVSNIMSKVRGNSVDAPIIRRDTYNSMKKLNGVSNSYSNTKYGL